MNILRLQNLLKNFSDEQLSGEMQTPTGNVPQFLVLTEMQRRKDMRDDFTAAQAEQSQTTVAEDMMMGESVPSSPPPTVSPSVGGPPMAGLGSLSQMPQQMPQQMPARMDSGGLIRDQLAYSPLATSPPPPSSRRPASGRPNFYDVVGEAHTELGQANDVLNRAQHEVGLALESIAPPQQARPTFGSGFFGKGSPPQARMDNQWNEYNAQRQQELFNEGGVVKAQRGTYTDPSVMQTLARINQLRARNAPPIPMMTSADLIAQESELGLQPPAEKQKNLINFLGLGTPGEFVTDFEQSKIVGDGTEVSDEVMASAEVPLMPNPALRDPTQPLGAPPMPTFSQAANDASQDQHTIAKADTVKRADSIVDRVFAAGGDYPYKVTGDMPQGFRGGAEALQDVKSTAGSVGDFLSSAANKVSGLFSSDGSPQQRASLPIFKEHQAVQRYRDQIEAIGGPVRTGLLGGPLESADAEAARMLTAEDVKRMAAQKFSNVQDAHALATKGPSTLVSPLEMVSDMMAQDKLRATAQGTPTRRLTAAPYEFAEEQAELAENPADLSLDELAAFAASEDDPSGINIPPEDLHDAILATRTGATSSQPQTSTEVVKRAVENIADTRPQNNAATRARLIQAAATENLVRGGGERLLTEASTVDENALLTGGLSGGATSPEAFAAERQKLMGAGRTGSRPTAAAKPKTLVEQYKDLMADYTAKNKNERMSNALLGASAAMLGSQSPYFGQALGAGISGGRAADAQFQKQISDQQKAMMNMVAKQAELDIASREAAVKERGATTAETLATSKVSLNDAMVERYGAQSANEKEKIAIERGNAEVNKLYKEALAKRLTGTAGYAEWMLNNLRESAAGADMFDDQGRPFLKTLDIITQKAANAGRNTTPQLNPAQDPKVVKQVTDNVRRQLRKTAVQGDKTYRVKLDASGKPVPDTAGGEVSQDEAITSMDAIEQQIIDRELARLRARSGTTTPTFAKKPKVVTTETLRQSNK